MTSFGFEHGSKEEEEEEEGNGRVELPTNPCEFRRSNGHREKQCHHRQ